MIQMTERAGPVVRVEAKVAPAAFSQAQKELAKSLAETGADEKAIQAILSDVSEKCGYLYDSPYYSYSANGAMSFQELDAYKSAVESLEETDEIRQDFNIIVRNIFNNTELDMKEKVSKIASVTTELQSRISKPVKKSIFEKVKGIFSDKEIPETSSQNGAFTAVKQADGRYRWVAVYSDTNWDRDKERFTEEAHKDYVDWVDRTKSYPDLRLWHIPGTSFGKTDMIDMDSNGYMVATGLIDSGKEYVVENLRQSSKVLGISHGFYFPSLINSEYSKGYRTYEISVLPWEKAANENTGFFAGEETPMLTPEKKAFIATTLGNDFAAKLETTLAEASSKAKEKGVSFKELMEVVMDAEVAAKETAKETKNETASPVAIEAIMEQMKAYFEPKFAEVSSTLKGHEEKFSKLEASDDDKISKAMSQKKGFNPTEDSSTQSNGNDKDVKAAKSEMSKTSEFQLPERFKDYAGLLKIPAGVE